MMGLRRCPFLSSLHTAYRAFDCSITEMPLSTSGLLVLAAPDGCPQGSLQLSINIKPAISKGAPDDAQVCGSRVILPRVNQ